MQLCVEFCFPPHFYQRKMTIFAPPFTKKSPAARLKMRLFPLPLPWWWALRGRNRLPAWYLSSPSAMRGCRPPGRSDLRCAHRRVWRTWLPSIATCSGMCVPPYDKTECIHTTKVLRYHTPEAAHSYTLPKDTRESLPAPSALPPTRSAHGPA